ncbi:MAG: hypothetical protein HYX49_01790 [Chloroflexi bacterium]|nr:hypothetical protein [Chloroflexota bacterium]
MIGTLSVLLSRIFQPRSGGVFQVRAENGGGLERPCGDARVGQGVATDYARRLGRGFLVPAEGVGGDNTKACPPEGHRDDVSDGSQ